MNTTTLRYLLISLTYFVACTGVFGYGLYTLNQQGQKLESIRAEHQAALKKEQAFIAITKIIEGTAAERAELTSYFITERDTISYIALIEEMAKQVGVTVQTNTLAIIPKNEKQKTPASLNAGFTVNGPKNAVKLFMQKIEQTPFHQTITDMTIMTDVAKGESSGTVLVQVTLAP